MVKPPYYDRLHMKQALSTKAEDTRVATNESQHATLAKKTGLRRCGRNCKTRGINNNQRADTDTVHNNFSPEEEELVIKLHATIGSRWSIIAQQIPERSDDDVKNLWNTKLKKKLSAMGIDPITHRPFSQILADYGNIGSSNMHKATGTTRFGYLNKDGTHPFIPYTSPEESSSQLVKLSNDSFSAPPPYDHSVELLSQLHAIKMVTEASNYSNTILEPSNYNNNSATIISAQMPNECISSSASPESPHQAQAQAAAAAAVTNKALALASPNFSWRDFLSEDTFLPAYNDNAQEDEKQHIKEAHHSIIAAKNSAPINNCFEGSSGSFVEDMIQRENEIFSETHGILEEPFYY